MVFREPATPACGWRADFHVIRDNLELRETTPPFAIEFSLSDPFRSVAEGWLRLNAAKAPLVLLDPACLNRRSGVAQQPYVLHSKGPNGQERP
jgi:hypothetical protein